MTTTTCSSHPRGVILVKMTPYTPFDSHSRCGKNGAKGIQIGPCYLKNSSDNKPNMGSTGLI